MSIELVKNTKFDIKEFNKSFEEQSSAKKIETKKLEEAKEKDMNYEVKEKKILDLTLREIFIDWKVSMDGVMNDIQQRNITRSTFTVDHRLLHVGITLFIFIIFFYILKSVLSSDGCAKVVNEYHIVTPS